MLRILQSGWLACLLGGLAYLGTTFALLSPDKFAGVQVMSTQAKKFINNEVSWRFQNPEFDQWVTELRREKEELALKEQQLKELAKRLEAERVEVTSVTQVVAQMQAQFDSNVIRFQSQEPDAVKRQARLLTTLSPEAAIALLNEMSDDDVVRIFYVMKTDQVSALIETMSKTGNAGIKRAALLTERLSRVLPPETASAPTMTFP